MMIFKMDMAYFLTKHLKNVMEIMISETFNLLIIIGLSMKVKWKMGWCMVRDIWFYQIGRVSMVFF